MKLFEGATIAELRHALKGEPYRKLLLH
jgi:hypothetical protein